MRIGLLSCARLPEPDHDAEPLLAAFRRHGTTPEVVPWDGTPVEFGAFEALLLRATWNYPENPAAFLAFCKSASEATLLLNPLETVRRNLHKGYLLELEAAGIPIVPTELVAQGDAPSDSQLGHEGVVVKPAVSCGSYRTRAFAADMRPEAAAYATALALNGDVLIQPLIDGFRDPGERALVWIDGELSHAVRKTPRFEGEDESVTVLDSVSAADEELARRALEVSAGTWIYARADLVDTSMGTVISELECIEPSLFFWARPDAADRLAVATIREVNEALSR